MEFLLAGRDREADCFISTAADDLQARDSGRMDHMAMQGALSANFVGLPGRGAPASARCRNVRIPGCDRTVLADAGESDDIMAGRNLERSGWAEKHSWTFRKSFTLPEELRSPFSGKEKPREWHRREYLQMLPQKEHHSPGAAVNGQSRSTTRGQWSISS